MTNRTTNTEMPIGPRAEPRRYSSRDGLSLVYDEVGLSDGDPIVFLHGGTDSRVTWDLLVPAVRERYRVLVPDARGHGDSDRDPDGYDPLDSFVGDVITFCDQIVSGPAVFVGASHGGVIAPAVAARRPDLAKGLLLLDPPMYGPVPDEIVALFDGLEGLLAAVAVSEDRQSALRDLVAVAPATSGEGTMLDALGEDGVDRLAYSWSRVDPAFVGVARAACTDGEPFALDAPVRCPVMVVCADPTAWGCCFRREHRDRLRAFAPQAEFVTASGLGHMIHHAEPAEVAEHLRAFLASR